MLTEFDKSEIYYFLFLDFVIFPKVTLGRVHLVHCLNQIKAFFGIYNIGLISASAGLAH